MSFIQGENIPGGYSALYKKVQAEGGTASHAEILAACKAQMAQSVTVIGGAELVAQNAARAAAQAVTAAETARIMTLPAPSSIAAHPSIAGKLPNPFDL